MTGAKYDDLRATAPEYAGLSDVECEVKLYRLHDRSTAALMRALNDVGQSAGLVMELIYHGR
jgi:hypothetical protein